MLYSFRFQSLMNTVNKLLIAIPAYNEQTTIGRVIGKIPRKIKEIKKINILVVDDGSFDQTKVIARKNKARVISHIINRGLGASLMTIFFVAKKMEADILVTIDADCQHDPKDIPSLVKPIINKQSDVVIGSRLLNSDAPMPVLRKIVNYLANIITYMLSGVWSTDSQSGFRAFSKKAINSIKLISQRMEVSSEIFQEIKKNNLRYCEIPIKSIYTKYSLTKGQSVLNALNVAYKLLIGLIRR